MFLFHVLFHTVICVNVKGIRVTVRVRDGITVKVAFDDQTMIGLRIELAVIWTVR